jgi:diadenosine tetraphosphate (Ap4A) HIT family hydrolase
MEKFILDARLAADGDTLTDLKLCRVILVNNKLFPWLIMVPRQPGLREIIDLSENDRSLLLNEIVLLSDAMKKVCKPDKLNIAALGNVVAQLHVHIVGRFEIDSAWPKPVFGQGKEPYSDKEYEALRRKFHSFLSTARH